MENNIKNYYLLISRMSFKQLYYRLVKIAKFKFLYKNWGRKIYPFRKLDVSYKNSNIFLNWNEYTDNSKDVTYRNTVINSADRIKRYEFTFLNTTYQFGNNGIDWSSADNKDKLWIYYLHYFEYLIELIEAYYFTKDAKYIEIAQELVNDWIDKNTPGQKNSWEAYTISLRLINWTYLWEVLQKENIELYAGFKVKMISSIQQQSKFLRANLERDLANNHFTANGKALFWVAVTFPFLEDSQNNLKKGIAILYSQLKKEVREDGSQYENSTSYQVMTAKEYIEVLIMADKNNIKLQEGFYTYTEALFNYILNIMKPDKTLPLLNDSVKDYPININELMAVGAVFFKRGDFKFAVGSGKLYYLLKLFGEKGLVKYSELPKITPNYNSVFLKGSKYCVMRSGWDKGNAYFLFDAGEIGPKHNAGHAHADNLSVYLHSNNEDILIDPGTYEYRKGDKRDYYRSTAAHNTLEINDQNQTTFWGPFRTGYIANSKLIEVNLNSTEQTISAMHDGYKRLKQKVIHRRDAKWDSNNCWFIKDSLNGKGIFKGNLYFQVGPQCKEFIISSNGYILKFNNSTVYLEFSSTVNFNLHLEKGWYSEYWKKENKIPKLRVSFTANSHAIIETKITIKMKKEN